MLHTPPCPKLKFILPLRRTVPTLGRVGRATFQGWRRWVKGPPVAWGHPVGKGSRLLHDLQQTRHNGLPALRGTHRSTVQENRVWTHCPRLSSAPRPPVPGRLVCRHHCVPHMLPELMLLGVPGRRGVRNTRLSVFASPVRCRGIPSSSQLLRCSRTF